MSDPVVVHITESPTRKAVIASNSPAVVKSPVGPPGPPGPPGPTGPGGSGSTVVVNQGSPLASWLIVHNMNKYPVPIVIDSAGDEIEPEWTYVDSNTIRLDFSAATSGTVYLN